MKHITMQTAVFVGTGFATGALLVGVAWAATARFGGDNAVVATVGNTAITRAQVLQQAERSAGLQALQNIIVEQLIRDGANKYKLTATEQEIADALKQFKAQYDIASDDQLQSMLAQNNSTMSDLHNELELQVLAEKLGERNVTVSDKEIQDYYNKNKQQFATPGSSRIPPLSEVKDQIVAAIKQSKAEPLDQLLAELAKEDPISVVDSRYQAVLAQITDPSS
jgi:foldase protein PrsA